MAPRCPSSDGPGNLRKSAFRLTQLERSAYERGCPLATVALETTSDDGELRQALNAAFEKLRECVACALIRDGETPERARRVAALIISTYEGALMQARVFGTGGPMRDATHMLLELLEQKPLSPKKSGKLKPDPRPQPANP